MSIGDRRDIAKIKVLIVDDIPDTRENLRKLLAFEPDIEVVGVAGTGRKAVELAQELKPDVVLMDINMPDMDGITATKTLRTAMPMAAVVIMSVQSDTGYLRQALLAGARDFLTKPISSEELYTTIRRAYESRPVVPAGGGPVTVGPTTPSPARPQTRAGHIIVFYSPQGGAGTTTLATNVSTALMRQDISVLLVDCDLQFGDVDTFLDLKSQSTLADLTKAVNDIDQAMIDSVLMTHGTGLKVLTAPPHPELAYDVASGDVRELIVQLAGLYDFVVVDTPTQFDDLTLKLFEIAERIVLVCNPTIPAVRNTQKIFSIFDSMEQSEGLLDKVIFVLNRVVDEKERGRGTLSAALIENHLKRQIVAQIPQDDRALLSSINQGVPLVAKLKSRSPGRELVALAEYIRQSVENQEHALQVEQANAQRSKSGIRALFGGTG